ncbi:MAG TPA: hypothetical protein DCY07_02840 [Rhodospirillaceae bacterium]|nr:hypothetical protein [Rhodospirillaceae bacterium]
MTMQPPLTDAQKIDLLTAQLAEARRENEEKAAQFAAACAEIAQNKKVREMLGSALRATGEVIVREKRNAEKFRKEGELDGLTGLFNRKGLDRETKTLLAEIERLNTGKEINAPLNDAEMNFVGVMAIDLDHFKNVNDTMGHGVGDQALIGVAEVMRKATRPMDIRARPGGDEFRIVMHIHAGSAEEAMEKLKLISDRVRVGIRGVGKELGAVLSGSIGAAAFGPLVHDAAGNLVLLEDTHARADYYSYVVKENDKDGVCVSGADGRPVIVGKEGLSLVLPPMEASQKATAERKAPGNAPQKG